LEKLWRGCRRNPALAALVSLSVVSLALLTVLVCAAWRPRPALPETSTAPIQIVTLQVRHYRGERDTPLGTLGKSSRAAQFDDDVAVHAELNRPAHCYLIAFNPNGQEQLCAPQDQSVAPEPITALDFPPGSAAYFSLTDGIGMQAFVLVASQAPLPAYREWRAASGAAPWQTVHAEGVWHFDGQRLEPIGPERGPTRQRRGPPQPLQDLCNFFKDHPHVDAVQVLAFPVRPKEEPPNQEKGK
jgi:hypothetical protein